MTLKPHYIRLLEPPVQSFFLFGPRGTGKTTWLRHRFPEAPRFDLLDERLYQTYLADPGVFAGELRLFTPGTLVIVDEVQRLPSLLNEVHRFIEERQLRFVLCGSSARKLKQAGTNLLAGRALRRHMHPFVPAELGDDFDLDEALRWGTIPVVWGAPDRREALEAYVQTYLREEVQAEALVRNLPGFARFLPVAALFHGQVINISGLARDAGVARTTVAGYLEILEDTLLSFRLPAYQARLRVRERKHPKLYWTDAGLVRAAKKHLGVPSPEELGALFEGWVAALLRAYQDYQRAFDEWHYWAPTGGAATEVDFLLRRDEMLVAIEVKSGLTVPRSALKSLRAIGELPGVCRRIVVTRGGRAQQTADGIEILPVATLVSLLHDDQLFP
ncbi:MAG: ATP-binding protein [Deltaproteobacteria bacterium]|nr:ATP-binding protein [Deltaproteobacteria bacterium]